MTNLTYQDFQNVLKAVEILNGGIEPESLPERMLNSVNYAVAGDITAFEMFNQAGEHQGILIYEPFDAISPQELEIYAQYVGEHPFYEAIIVDHRLEAIKIADFVPDKEFTMTRLYNEYYRRVGVSRQICVTMNINSDCLMLCTLSRGGRDFDEIERGKLNLLSPHFTAAVRNTNSFEQLQSERQNWQSIAESTGRAIIVLDTAGKVKNLTSRSTDLLKKYFADDRLRINDLPDSLYRWLMQNIEHSTSAKEFYLPPKPLTIAIDGGKLRIQFCFNRNANSINLLLNEEKELSPQHLFHLGLTKRETEILYWIVRGKSNYEIGILCNISPRTVQKHVEHICNKLGAENRTAAAMRAVEIVH